MVRRNFSYVIGAIVVLLLLGIGYLFYGGRGTVVPQGAEATSSAASVAVAETATTTDNTDALFLQNNGVLESQKSGVHVGADVISETAPPPDGYIQYKNEKYGFSYYHSPQAKITEYEEGGGAMTLVHENFEKVRGFQVFIVPYKEPLISEERFKEDVPSGVRKNAEDATLDGVRAVTFNSQDATLGETREIWVIRNGYLYEITTFSGVGQWFTPIIQSWSWL